MPFFSSEYLEDFQNHHRSGFWIFVPNFSFCSSTKAVKTYDYKDRLIVVEVLLQSIFQAFRKEAYSGPFPGLME